MGCLCPCFKLNSKVSDLASVNIQSSDSQCPQRVSKINIVPPVFNQITVQEDRHQTEQQFQELQHPQSPHQVQSNLNITYQLSIQNSECSSVGASHLIDHNMVIIRHSEIHQSMVYRWQKPDFRVEQLFVQVNFDKLFKS